MMTVLMVMKKKMMMRMTMMIAVMVMVRTPAIACKTWENVSFLSIQRNASLRGAGRKVAPHELLFSIKEPGIRSSRWVLAVLQAPRLCDF